MLWLLADASLNQYLQSQVVLQGKYYTGQTVTLKQTEYLPSTGQGSFKQLTLKNNNAFSQENLMMVDEVTFSMAKRIQGDKLITISSLNINTLTINVEQFSTTDSNNINNIEQVKLVIINKLADDYPELYPDISAKKYALKNPDLNADVYIENHPQNAVNKEENKGKELLKFVGSEFKGQEQGLCFDLIDYLELVDWTGRVIRDDKRGSISSDEPSLLCALGVDSDTWLGLANDFGKDYHGAVGSLEELALFAEHTGKRWISGQRKLDNIYH